MPTNSETLKALGMKLEQLYVEYCANRSSAEKQYMKNYRQYRGIYDPEIKIPTGYSRAYPKITRVKVRSLLAKLMEMLFPSTERNWDLQPSPKPNISPEALQQILAGLREAAEQGELNGEVIDEAVKLWAKDRAAVMTVDMDDALKQMDFRSLAKKVLKSGIMYGTGVIRGPMVMKVTETRWNLEGDEITVDEEEVLQPFFEFVSVWDWFPDYSIKSYDLNDKIFEKHLMNRHDVIELAKRGDFKGNIVREYLRTNPEGDYQESSSDLELRGIVDKENSPGKQTRLYEIKQCVGYISGTDLVSAGAVVDAEKLDDDFLADIWFVGDKIIKAAPLPYKNILDFYHVFVMDEEEETESAGPALPENIRDSQMAVAASTRMLMDNASISTGAIFEVNIDLLAPGQEVGNLHAFKVIRRQGVGAESQYPAIRTYKFDSHINELLAIISQFRDLSDEESMLPKFAIGGESRPSEGFRTVGGSSMLFGASNTTLKDLVRQFDKFTSSVMTSLYDWFILFGTNAEAKGDYQIIARGSTSLIAKELRAQALDNLSVTMSPEERRHIDDRKFLVEKLKVRDLEADNLLLPIETVQENDARAAEAAQAESAANQGLVTARTKKLLTSAATELADAQRKGDFTKVQIAEVLSRVEKNLAATGSIQDATYLQFTKQLSESLQNIQGGEVIEGEFAEEKV